MTYSSRKPKISWGEGRDERDERPSLFLSSAMMSLQTSTHSSQINTDGPAISLRTSFWSLLQNEHRRISASPLPFIAKPLFLPLALAPHDHLIHDTIRLGLLGIHDEVAVGVRGDLLDGLLRVHRDDLVEPVLEPKDLLGLDCDVRGLSLGSAPRLMD